MYVYCIPYFYAILCSRGGLTLSAILGNTRSEERFKSEGCHGGLKSFGRLTAFCLLCNIASLCPSYSECLMHRRPLLLREAVETALTSERMPSSVRRSGLAGRYLPKSSPLSNRVRYITGIPT